MPFLAGYLRALKDTEGQDECCSLSRASESPSLPTDFLTFTFDLLELIIQVLQVNLKTVWLLCQAAGQHMVPRREGKIINFGSLLSYQGGLTVSSRVLNHIDVRLDEGGHHSKRGRGRVEIT